MNQKRILKCQKDHQFKKRSVKSPLKKGIILYNKPINVQKNNPIEEKPSIISRNINLKSLIQDSESSVKKNIVINKTQDHSQVKKNLDFDSIQELEKQKQLLRDEKKRKQQIQDNSQKQETFNNRLIKFNKQIQHKSQENIKIDIQQNLTLEKNQEIQKKQQKLEIQETKEKKQELQEIQEIQEKKQEIQKKQEIEEIIEKKQEQLQNFNQINLNKSQENLNKYQKQIIENLNKSQENFNDNLNKSQDSLKNSQNDQISINQDRQKSKIHQQIHEKLLQIQKQQQLKNNELNKNELNKNELNKNELKNDILKNDELKNDELKNNELNIQEEFEKNTLEINSQKSTSIDNKDLKIKQNVNQIMIINDQQILETFSNKRKNQQQDDDVQIKKKVKYQDIKSSYQRKQNPEFQELQKYNLILKKTNELQEMYNTIEKKIPENLKSTISQIQQINQNLSLNQRTNLIFKFFDQK